MLLCYCTCPLLSGSAGEYETGHFLNQARADLRVPGFIELLLSVNVCMHVYVCVCVFACVSALEAINN